MNNAPETILVVDDTPLNRMLLSTNLRQAGYNVETAENGRQALEMLDRVQPDLIVLDILMPEMDGFQVLEQLKRDGQLRRLPVIVVSSADELQDVVRCIEMGAEDHLPKPFEPVLLQARISACLEKKRLRDNEQELYRRLERNFKRLQELERLRDELTHMIIHDLRTPLTSIIGGLETIGELGPLNDDQREFVDMSLQGGNVLLNMINDLLDISKLEEGALTLEYRELEPAALLETAVRQVSALAAENEQTLMVDAPAALPRFQGDEDKLRRTLVNLLGNALKFTPAGGVITVSAKTDPETDSLLFAVSDTGEGIPEDQFARIFEKFGQVESRKAGRKMSTGLGLTFCKMAVEAHGGRIWVESRMGEGSTFQFTIPLTPRADQEAGLTNGEPPPSR